MADQKGDAPRVEQNIVATNDSEWLSDLSARVVLVDVETRLHEPHLSLFAATPSRGEMETFIWVYCPASSIINVCTWLWAPRVSNSPIVLLLAVGNIPYEAGRNVREANDRTDSTFVEYNRSRW